MASLEARCKSQESWQSARESFSDEGYLHLRGAVSKQTCHELIEHFMHLPPPDTTRWSVSGYHERLTLVDMSPEERRDILRYMRPHHFDETTLRFCFDPELYDCVEQILPGALLGHTAFIPKAPGALGCAPHPDTPFFEVDPGPCLGVFVALEAADEENGTFFIVPGTHKTPRHPLPHPPDRTIYATNIEFDVPAGVAILPLLLEAGDVVFFDANILHGAGPNRTERWRRSLVLHYAPSNCQSASNDLHPLRDRNGGEKRVAVIDGAYLAAATEQVNRLLTSASTPLP